MRRGASWRRLSKPPLTGVSYQDSEMKFSGTPGLFEKEVPAREDVRRSLASPLLERHSAV